MRAVVQDRYGPPDEVLTVRDVAVPPVRDDEVLVRVRAASVHVDVWHVVTGRPYVLRLMGNGLRKPRHIIPGTDLAGTIEAVGRDVTRFKAGDEVFGDSLRAMAWRNGGTFAEYAAVPEDVLALKPHRTSFEQAAAVPAAGWIALMNLRGGLKPLEPGLRVLINGAGGSVGSLAVQIAKADGARVTGVDRAARLAMIRSLGADAVVDYTTENVLDRGERYDLILDVASTLTLDASKRALAPDGVYVLIGHDHFGRAAGRVFGSIPRFFGLAARSPFERHLRPLRFRIPAKREIIGVLQPLLESGALTPIVARTFPLSEVRAAMRCLQDGSLAGRIVITPDA